LSTCTGNFNSWNCRSDSQTVFCWNALVHKLLFKKGRQLILVLVFVIISIEWAFLWTICPIRAKIAWRMSYKISIKVPNFNRVLKLQEKLLKSDICNDISNPSFVPKFLSNFHQIRLIKGATP
jgi:hypothetical protein